MLGITKSNFLKIGSGWTIVENFAKAVVYIGTHFFPQIQENSRSHSNACNTLVSSKKPHTNIK